jgi:hypothetical protein
MAQTISGQKPPGPYPVLPLAGGSADIVYNGGTTAYQTPIVEAKTLVIAKNTDSASHSVTITSVPDQFNRSGDLTYTVSAGGESMLGPFQNGGWGGSNGLAVTVSDTHLNIGIITLP